MGEVVALVASLGGISRLLVLAGLITGVVGVVGMLRGAARYRMEPVGALRYLTGPVGAFLWPLLLVWLGFWLGSETSNFVIAVVVGPAMALIALCSVRLLRSAHAHRKDHEVASSALATVLACCLLLEFGLLLTIRLVVVRDPSMSIQEAMDAKAFEQAPSAVFLPLSVLLAVVMVPVVWRLLPARFKHLLATPKHKAASVASSVWERAPGMARRMIRALRVNRTLRWVGAILLIGGVFFSAIVDKPKHLVIFGIATAEYGKVLYIGLLVVALAGYAHRFGRPGLGWRHRLSQQHRLKRMGHLLYPLGLFAAVFVASFAKSDFGPLIGLFAVTFVLMALLVIDGSRQSAKRRGARSWEQATSVVRHTGGYLVVLVLVVLIGTLALTLNAKTANRYEAMAHTWEYGWSVNCTPVPAGVQIPGVPRDTTVCRYAVDADTAGKRSQIAQGLAAIADGGLWGRGLSDTTNRVPVGESDLVLAVIWAKLGGITVVLLGVLLALLATALTRTAKAGGRGPTAERLFAIGVAVLLVSQFVYVLAATLGVAPHSGITVPFLSRGGQSTVALGAAVILAVWAVYRRRPEPEGPVRTPPARPVRAPKVPVAAAFVLVVCLLGVGMVTAWPYKGYATDRPYCLTERPRADPEVCSTDRIAVRRNTVELSVGGSPQYVRDRIKREWKPIGTPVIALDDLGGLIQAGGTTGVVDGALSELVSASSGLSNPLLPPAEREPGSVELTIDPTVQRATANALRSNDPGGGPLAGGIVVLDPATGRVLAAASAPGHIDPKYGTGRAPTEEEVKDFDKSHPTGVYTGTTIDENRHAECSDSDREVGNDCWRWKLEPGTGPESPEAIAERSRYVDGRTDVTLPASADNRALGRGYGLGSTFKVVIAAAYLRQPGKSVNDTVAAPAEYPVRGRKPVQNSPRGLCKNGESGRITVADALAVSCNTAFLELADQMPWSLIRDTALDFGFTDPPAKADRGRAWVAGTELGTESRVPHDSSSGDLPNNVLGGLNVEGTPLQMAAVVGAVANGGTLVQPRLVDATADPGGGARTEVVPQIRHPLGRAQAEQLMAGLAGTVEHGTARKLPKHPGHQIWAKTGTHEKYNGERPPPGEFAQQIAWLTGVVSTGRGPVAFAVAVETGNETRGAERARWLADAVISSITEVRR